MAVVNEVREALYDLRDRAADLEYYFGGQFVEDSVVDQLTSAVAAVLGLLFNPDTCRVGDPDPTPDLGEMCGAEHPPPAEWSCTRAPHDPKTQHVAGSGGIVAATWKTEGPA